MDVVLPAMVANMILYEENVEHERDDVNNAR